MSACAEEHRRLLEAGYLAEPPAPESDPPELAALRAQVELVNLILHVLSPDWRPN